jgi:hypothetical protein
VGGAAVLGGGKRYRWLLLLPLAIPGVVVLDVCMLFTSLLPLMFPRVSDTTREGKGEKERVGWSWGCCVQASAGRCRDAGEAAARVCRRAGEDHKLCSNSYHPPVAVPVVPDDSCPCPVAPQCCGCRCLPTSAASCPTTTSHGARLFRWRAGRTDLCPARGTATRFP